MNFPRFTSYILLAVFALVAGCKYKAPPDPLKGWKLCQSQDPKYLDQAIRGDYQGYIQALSPEEKRNVSPTRIFEDGAEGHAVEVIIGVNGRGWRHILIYDKDSKRIRTIKYATGYYAS